MTFPTRRDFSTQLLGSLLSYGLIETLWRNELLAEPTRADVQKWMGELNELCQSLKGRKLKDVDFQAKLEELYRRVDLKELIALIDFERLSNSVRYPEKGAASLGVDLSKVEGLSRGVVFGKQIFAMKKGRSIVPHGHDNMCTGFIILQGDFTGRHYDRVEDNADHYLIKPTIDRTFKPGECSTISDTKDNVHWFRAESDYGFVFNIHVLGYNPENKKISSRVYVDPEGEKTAGGLIVAKKISSAECHRKYG